LFQVEYAVAAINSANPAVGVCTKEGIVIAGEKKVISELLAESKSSEKLYPIDSHICCAVAGLDADANILLQQARVEAQRYLFRFNERIPVELLVTRIAEYKQFYTQSGGLRPFGTTFLYAGWDKEKGYQLLVSDPSGNYAGWRATAIGRNNVTAQSALKAEYDEDMDFDAACKLAVRVLVKAMDTTAPSAARMDVMTLRLKAPAPSAPAEGGAAAGRDGATAGALLSPADEALLPSGAPLGPTVVQSVLDAAVVDELIRAAQAEKADSGDV
jgi:20S proteasome subunit alpha 3